MSAERRARKEVEFQMPFGKFRGHFITRVPPSYLQWMITQGHPMAFKAQEELERRGTKCTYRVDIKAHAIDRASQRLMYLWVSTAMENEGLFSWLVRRASDALDTLPKDQRLGNLKLEHDGVIFVMDFSTLIPVVKSVWGAGTEGEP